MTDQDFEVLPAGTMKQLSEARKTIALYEKILSDIRKVVEIPINAIKTLPEKERLRISEVRYHKCSTTEMECTLVLSNGWTHTRSFSVLKPADYDEEIVKEAAYHKTLYSLQYEMITGGEIGAQEYSKPSEAVST